MFRRQSVACVLGSVSSLTTQRRGQYQSKTEDRDAETFLAQYCPFAVLGLEPTSNVQQINDAHRRMVQYYAPNGPKPNKQMFENVERAHKILNDSKSPFFTKARPHDHERHELALNLMSPKERNTVQLKAYLSFAVVLFGVYMIIYVLMLPTKKAIRAVTR